MIALAAAILALSDPARIVPQATPPPLGYLEQRIDTVYGYSVRRVTDSAATGSVAAVPAYSQLQAWNADTSLVLTKNRDILDARTWKRLHRVDYGWPAWGGGLRWSPTEPDVLYYTGGADGADSHVGQCPAGQARLMRYRLSREGERVTGSRDLVQCFSEYTALARDASFEELSDDGRYVALVGRRPDGVHEVFAYDIPGRAKGAAHTLPPGRCPNWAGMSPSGRYVLMMWGRGPGQYQGLEAYDRETMAYAGKVTTSSGHGDLAADASGNEFYVYTNANNAYFLTGQHYIVRSRIPDGVVYHPDGQVDAANTVSSGASVPMLSLDWQHGIHVSCRGIRAPDPGCVVSTYGGAGNGQQAFENEIFFVGLDSRREAPKVERLAQHQSEVRYLDSLPNAECDLGYWAQPHATVSPDGRYVMFGSSWGRRCEVDAYVIDRRPEPATAPPPSAPAPNPTLASIPPGTARNLGRYTCTQDPRDARSCATITDYSGFKYDKFRHKMLMYGGGHAATMRSDVDVFDFTTLKWQSAYPSTPCSLMTAANFDRSRNAWISNSTPWSIHSYDKLVLTENTKELILIPRSLGARGLQTCAEPNLPDGSPGRVPHYNPDSAKWSYGGVPGAWETTYVPAAEYDPVSGRVVIMGQEGLWTYDPVAKASAWHRSVPPAVSIAQNLIYYPPTDKMYYIATCWIARAAVWEVTLDRSDFSRSTIIPLEVSGDLPFASLGDAGETGFAYDPVSGIIGGGVRNGSFYAFDPRTRTFTAHPIATEPGAPAVGTQAYHALDYNPVDGVYLFVTDAASGRYVWAYRHGVSVQPPEPAPDATCRADTVIRVDTLVRTVVRADTLRRTDTLMVFPKGALFQLVPATR
jgi:hypothetical protein